MRQPIRVGVVSNLTSNYLSYIMGAGKLEDKDLMTEHYFKFSLQIKLLKNL